MELKSRVNNLEVLSEFKDAVIEGYKSTLSLAKVTYEMATKNRRNQ